MTARHFLLLTVIAILFSLYVSCSENGMIAGGTDTETGGTTVVGCIFKNNGSPAANTIVTILYGWLDPRLRLERK